MLDEHLISFDSESKKNSSIKIEELYEIKESTEYKPQYNVVLLDDNDHTYDYVIEMLMNIFGYDAETAFEMAFTVDSISRVVVYTSTKEESELKREQILSYGPDWRLNRSRGSMNAITEPVS